MLDTLCSIEIGSMSRRPNPHRQPPCTTGSLSTIYPEELFPDLSAVHQEMPWSTDLFGNIYPPTLDASHMHRADRDLYYPHNTGLGIFPNFVAHTNSPAASSNAPTAATLASIGGGGGCGSGGGCGGGEFALTDSPFGSRPPSTNPTGRTVLQHATSVKRSREEESSAENTPPTKRRAKSIPTADLNEEERLLLRLKDDESLPWKDIALRFQSDLGKAHQVPALQMRYKRLREKLRPWTETDLNALRQAHDYWAKNKWDIISSRMMETMCVERWPAKYCARKWEELNPGLDVSREAMASPARVAEESDVGSPEVRPSRTGTPRDDRILAL